MIASGGVSSLADLRALAELAALGLEGAIVGKALYAGAFTLPEALAAPSASLDCLVAGRSSASSRAWTSMPGGSSRA